MKTIKLKIGYDNVPSDYTGIVEWEERKICWFEANQYEDPILKLKEVEEWEIKAVYWYKNGNLHREDGPACV